MTPSSPQPSSGNSRRVQTVLLVAVVVLLAAILIVLLVNTSGNDSASLEDEKTSSGEDSAERPTDDPATAARRFITFTLVDRSPDKAENLMCDDYTGQHPQEMTDKLTEWEEEAGVLAAVNVDDVEPTSANSDMTFNVRIMIESGEIFEKWDYEVSVEDDGDAMCVGKVK